MHRILRLGVRKVAVSGMHPLGCLPPTTSRYSYNQCNDTLNDFVDRHNNELNQAVTKLNQQVKHHSTFLVFDFYDSFISVMNHPSKIKEKFRPCCDGISTEYLCGSVENNVKKYKICEHPESTFFWDGVHPSQAAWYAVYQNLQATSAFQQIRH